MKNTLLLSFLLTFITISLHAGGISGTINDIEGNPLPYATVFIQSQATGTTTNLDGIYSIRLESGTYEVLYQYLGYKSVSRRVVVSNNSFTEINVVLEQEVLNLEAVEIIDGRENPAYTIMRKAIAKSSYHIQQLDSYNTIVYMKGSGRINKVPGLFKKKLEKEGLDTKRVFTMESVSEFTYTRPNTYKEKVISINAEGDANNMSPNQYLNASFYEPKVNGAISPLSPRAFGYYKFELEGTFFDQGKMINKIKITPRSRGEKVFEGFISIVDEEWAIHSLDVNTITEGIKFNIQQVYAPIEDKAWMPINNVFIISGKLMGFGFEFNYLATASDYEIELNPDLKFEMVVIDETIEKEKATEIKKRSKRQKKKDDELSALQQKMSEGEEISRKDLRKLMKNYAKEERKEQEEPKVESNRSYAIDTLATKRDSSYWANIRSVPLTKLEVRGYEITDSLRIVEIEEEKKDSVKQVKKDRFMPWEIFFPNNIKLAKGTYLNFGSPIYKLGFNTVEGYNTNYDIHLSKNWEDGKRLETGGVVAYSLARNLVTWKAYADFDYGKRLHGGNINIQGGTYVNQINPDDPINPIINTFMTLWNNDNYMKLYQKDYISIENKKRIRPNFELITKAEWANRMHLENADVRSWVKNSEEEFTSNTPENLELSNTFFDTNRALTINLGVEYQPWLRYTINNDVKNISSKATPTFFLNYNKGIPDVAKSTTDFDQVEIGFKHQFDIGIRAKLDVHSRFGHFFNNDQMTFLDYQHFQANLTPFVTTDPVETFRLLDYYLYSTNNTYFIGHGHIQFRKFLVTQIFEAQMLGLKENVFVNYLATDKSENYFEVGYAVDKIFRFLRLEVVTSYRDFKYESWGIRIGVASSLVDGQISF
ncbi:MAG: DUF5686 and carboxypeptidase regulatory-like domain-containing protein [Saprospiraceae bacterium]